MRKKSELTDEIVNWFYQHSAGTLSHVIFLFQTAQEISILDGRECVDITSLEAAYQRMRMLHMHIQPEIVVKKKASKRKKECIPPLEEQKITGNEKSKEETGKEVSDMIQKAAHEKSNEEWLFSDMAKEAKKKHLNVLELLQDKISVTEVAV